MIFNKNTFKQLFFTIPSLLVLILICIFMASISLINISESVLIYCIFILGISEIIVFAQMIYLMIHAGKYEQFEIGKKIAWIIALYMLNLFVIPIYTYKYLLEDSNFKVKSLIHLVISSITLLFCIFCISFLIFKSFFDFPTKHQTKDGRAEVTVEAGYQIKDTDYDLYLTNEEKQLTSAFFTYDLNIYDYTEEEILYYQIDFFKESRENFRMCKNMETIDLGDKKITYLEYLGTMDGYDESLYRFATITFDEDEEFILYAIQVIIPSTYNDYNEELFGILESAEILH